MGWMGTADEFDEVCVDWADHAWGFCDRHLQGMGEMERWGMGQIGRLGK
jgi:hypothetical protein